MAGDSILQNVCAKNAAKELLKLVPGVLTEDVDERKFWEALATLAADHCGCVLATRSADVGAMNEEEALAFEKRKVPYGVHEGELVGTVPTSYWLRITESEWTRDLRRYMKSRRFMDRQP